MKIFLKRYSISLIALFSISPPLLYGNESFNLPEGFEISLYAGDDLAHDIHTLTVDSHGRVVVAGKGYVKILHDHDGDGKADEATLFSDGPADGARGMYFDGNDLICTGNRKLMRLHDRDGDSQADGTHDTLLSGLSHGGDHAANGVIKGPDGWIYNIGGNDAGYSSRHINLTSSPVKKPNCGGVVRISPDGKKKEIYADGFRNPYDLAFDASGALFTYDADGERICHLPWYTPTRIFDIAQGMHHGWILTGWKHAWNRPEYFPDNVERLWEVGRGSPTGVLVYRHHTFPEIYHNGLFALCWSMGKIYFFPLTRKGSTFETEQKVFLESKGDTGIAPVDLAVGTKGELYLAIGGRGTKGSVYRIRYTKEQKKKTLKSAKTIDIALRAPQPLSSWSRAQWVPLAKKLKVSDFERAALDKQRSTLERIRAIEILVEVHGGVRIPFIRKILSNKTLASSKETLAARALWALSRSPDSNAAKHLFAKFTQSESPLIARTSWEALAASPTPLDQKDLTLDWEKAFASPNRRVRAAALLAAQGPGNKHFNRNFVSNQEKLKAETFMGILQVNGFNKNANDEEKASYFMGCFYILLQSQDPRIQLDALRLIQIGIGDIKLTQERPQLTDGYSASKLQRISKEPLRFIVRNLADKLPNKDSTLNREITRTLAMLKAEHHELFDRWAKLWTSQTSLEDSIHYLLAASQLPGKRTSSFTEATAIALLSLHPKMLAEKRDYSRNWPIRIRQAYQELCRRDPSLKDAILEHPSFGIPQHTLFIQDFSTEKRKLALRKIFKTLEAQSKNPSPQMTSELIRLGSDLLGKEILPTLRSHWTESSLRDSLALALAHHADPIDRARLIEVLESSRQASVVEKVAFALKKMPKSEDKDQLEEEFIIALEALQNYSSIERQKATRSALSSLLTHWTDHSPIVKDNKSRSPLNAWLRWLQSENPQLAKEIEEDSGDLASLLKRLPKISWEKGNAEKGKRIYQLRGCQTCHQGARRLGPELKGVTNRLNQKDLFIAIADPSRDISPAYISKEVTTKTGKTYIGTMIYQSPATSLLQISAETTVRFKDSDIVSIESSLHSFMPAGLLAGASDQDLADLYAYMKTLK